MTNHELLGLAAKAARLEINYWRVQGDTTWAVLSDGSDWNPLTDDGDALRLAVKLGFDIHIVNHPNKWCVEVFTDTKSLRPAAHLEERTTPDPYAATRRAIVRAAAEIGRNMK